MAAIKHTLSNALLNAVLRNVAYSSPSAVYVALFTAAPTGTAAGTEVSGGSYARQAATFSAAASGAIENSADISFPIASGALGPITHFAICDAVSSGNQLFFGALSSSVTLATGERLVIAAGDIDISEL